MKKCIALAVIAVLLLVSGCAQGGAAAARRVEDADVVAQAVLQCGVFTDELVRAPDDVVGEYYKLDDTVTDHAIYISGTGATAQEVAVLITGGEESAMEILARRLEDLELRFANYVPGEMNKIQNPVFIAGDGVVVMALSDDPDAARDAVEEALEG